MNKNRFWMGTVLTLTAILLLTGGAVRTGEAAVKEHEANVHAGISFMMIPEVFFESTARRTLRRQ